MPTKSPIATKPVLDNFLRPLTKVIDSKKNKIQIIPKKTKPEDTGDVNLSKELSKLFPEIEQVTEQIDDQKNEQKFYLKLATMKNHLSLNFLQEVKIKNLTKE